MTDSQQSRFRLIKKHQLGLIALIIILTAEVVNVLPNNFNGLTIQEFYASPNNVDVGEPITFFWRISGNTKPLTIRIKFGDGTIKLIPGAGIYGNYTHNYTCEGKYNATLMVQEYEGDFYWKSVPELIVIRNNPPQFDQGDISFKWESIDGPFEDENVNISVALDDSEVDLKEGVIHYIYDFGDGKQITSNKSYVFHNWTTAGNYPITVTAIDDQGALNKATKFLNISNKDPKARFTLGAGVPATFSFSQDIIGSVPFRWKPSSSNASKVIKVIEEKDSHGKVLEVIANKELNLFNNYIETIVTPQDFGTVEYHFMTTNTTSAVGYLSLISNEGLVLSLFTKNGLWYYQIPDKTNKLNGIEIPENDTWHHLRIDFCIDDSGITPESSCYGLKSNEFRVVIDGKDFVYKDLGGTSKSISNIRIGAHKKSLGKAYLDSVGFSWDENYNVGDNFQVYKPEYYATYDWRENIVGSKPYGWELYDNDYPSYYESEPIYSEEFESGSDYWNLFNVSQNTMNLRFRPSDDTFAINTDSDKNYGNSYHLLAGNLEWKWTSFSKNTNWFRKIRWDGENYWLIVPRPIPIELYNQSIVYKYDKDWNLIGKFTLLDHPVYDACWDGTYWWVAGGDLLHKYDENWIFIKSVNFDYPLPPWDIWGIEWDGSFWWAITNVDNKKWIYKYNPDWSFTGIIINVRPKPASPSDICWDGTYYWVLGYYPHGGELYKYTSNWEYTGVHYRTEHSNLVIDSLCWDGFYWWLTANHAYSKTYKVFKHYGKNSITESYLKREIPYLSNNATHDSILDIFVFLGNFDAEIDVYSTFNFSETLLTWNNRPSIDKYLSTKSITETGWKQFNLGAVPYDSYYLKLTDDTKINFIDFYSSDNWFKRPIIRHYLSKIYQGSGMLYCQTNMTERLSLRSKANINYNLRKGDKIDIIFNTTSSNNVFFNLLNSKGIRQSFIISEDGNSNFNDRIITLYVSEDVSIDQLEFSGIFEETNYLIIKSIKIYRGIRSDISIIDYGGNFGKVVQLRDRSSKNEHWIENYFENQFYGTTEFWLQSTNIYDITSYFSFWDNSEMIFNIFMHQNKWKYTLNGIDYYEIFGCGIPTANGWHHVRIDFNKTIKEFRIYIDGNEADPIAFVDFEAINKIRISTNKENEGYTWIDAIGYSWDEFYQIGDNKISLVIYPEKTNIQFSAADSLDTDSDIDSLRYYWDFGDGTSSFGKYVSHDYLTSGRYNVTLYCKDDNGAIDKLTQIIQVYNLYPEVNLTGNIKEIIVNEGETIFFNAQSWDEITDFAKLTYWWNFNVSNYNIFDFIDGESDGWRKTHIYTDDFEGDAGVLVKDTEGAYNYDFIKILINNVDPLISIYDVYIISNISFEVIRSDLNKFSNFTFDLLANGQSQLSRFMSFNNTDNLLIFSDEEQIFMTLSKNWEIQVNSTALLPENSWFQYNINFEYLNGEIFTISSGKLYGTDYGYWSVNLDPLWMNSMDNTFNQPLTFDGLIWDPSIDDINLDVSYETELTYEIECSNDLPLDISFVIEKPLGTTFYYVEIYEENNKTYASIKASQLFYSNYYSNNQFPTELDISFSLYPIIDLHEILQDYTGLNDLEILSYLDCVNYINAEVMDDDGGKNDITLEFKSIFEIKNLSPNIDVSVPTNGSLNKEIAFYVKINDFNQFRTESETDILDFINDDVPIVEDFSIYNGTMTNEEADLYFQDEDCIILTPDHKYEKGIVFYDDFEDGIRDSNWTDDANFGKIYEKDGVLKIKASWYSFWGKLWKWFVAWAPYCKIPLSKFSRDNWQVSVNIAYPTTAPKHHHYGLMLYENDQNVWMFGPYDDGKIKIVKIIDKKMISCSEIVSNHTYLRIRRFNDIYIFEHSPDNKTWYILEGVADLGINATNVGLFHRAWCFTRSKWVYFDNFIMKEPFETDYVLNFTAKLHFDDIDNDYLLKYLKLFIDCKTDSNQLVNISLYNFSSQSWDIIDTRYITDTYHNLNYPIVSADHFNFENDLYVRVEALNKTDKFYLFIDQLRLEYCFSDTYDYRLIKFDYEGDDVPDQLSEDFELIRGSPEQIGDLESNDSDYSIYNSNYNSNKENEAVIIKTKFYLEDANIYDKIERIDLLLSLKTNISQLVDIYIFNYTSMDSNQWIKIYSLISLEFSPIIIPIDAIQDELYVSNEILIRIDAINESISFSIYLDQLKLEYTYIPYHLLRTDEIFAYIGQLTQYSYMNLAGDLSNEYYYTYWGSSIFYYEGKYLVTIGVEDGNSLIKRSRLIHVFNRFANSKIDSMADNALEDEMVHLSASIESYGIYANETRYEWSFGDGTYAYIQNPTHSWSKAGTYDITLMVIDCFGNHFKDVKEIKVKERIPEILGPFTFHGIQGQAVVLDIEIYDSFLDEPDLKYEWYSTSSDLITKSDPFSTEKKPIIILNTGNYKYSLKVIDSSGQIAVANFSIEVEDFPPLALVSSYCYLGNNKTTLEVKAYVYDSYIESNYFDFEWKVHNALDEVYFAYQDTLIFNCINTTLYYGDVIITDLYGKSAIASFYINSFIDSNGNGYSDELERQLRETGQTIYTDEDNDGLSDIFETQISQTDPFLNDSDGDGLFDGYNNFTGIGELTYGSDPNSNDTDNDFLLDGFEVFGWNITVNSRTYLATSNPVRNNTDGDSLGDYEEYQLKLDPRNPDTDSDGLIDDIDPFPLLIDGDDDGLSDYHEILLGTSVNSSDTDGDGLTDGQEVIGWEFITNPLSSDSDHDFLTDSTEIMVSNFKIDKRIELDQPVSLLFNGKCEKAATAQIAITITYGSMAVENENTLNTAPDLNITILKDNANIVIFNGTTNSSSVFSKIIDFKDIIESQGLSYQGEYVLLINNTEAEYYLEQFEIEVVKYLNPNLDDYDEDGIMDGVETGLLVRGRDRIDYKELYGDTTINFPINEIAWWALDDGIGYSAKDYSPYGNDGLLKNMEYRQWLLPGKVGTSCLGFNGNDDYIDCGNATLFNFERNNTFSLSLWLKTTAINSTILSKMDVENDIRGYNIYLDDQGIINAQLINTWDKNAIWIQGSTKINNDNWHFIAITYNGSSNASGIKIYVDGNLDHMTILNDNLNKTLENGANFTIGTSFRDDFYKGHLDDIRVFDFELSENDIIWLNNSYSLQFTRSLNQDSVPNVKNSLSLEIPHTGRVYNANVTIAMSPEEMPIGNGSINIQLIKEELNSSIDDFVLFEKSLEYNNTESFYFEKFVEVKPFLANNLIRAYYGEYSVKIEINGTDSVDKFIVDKFYLETSTFIEAGPTDTCAWITDPANNDTDIDGWLDSYEIFETETNPLSDDTDGDGAIDSYDRDPLRDLMIEISPIYGIHSNLWFWEAQPLLQIVVTFELSGKAYYFCTTMKKGHVGRGKSFFDGNHGSREHHYYANFDDDMRTQGDIIHLTLQLWDMGPNDIFGNPLWDTCIVSSLKQYEIGEEALITASQKGTFGHSNKMQIKVNTFSIEKANTIAIYENGTVFNGHYQKQEKMNIFQLYINGVGSYGPFVAGPNVIVIPTSLFTETIINAKIQKKKLHDTKLYKEGCSEFISINRTGETEESCDEVDFVFVRYDISFTDAMEVLNLLCTCILNETTGETEVRYCYASKEENDFNPVLMNLAIEVLGYVPWVYPFSNSDQGRTPRGFPNWLADKISEIIDFVVGIFIAIAEAFIAIWEAIVEFVNDILMDLIPFLADLILLLVKIALLIYFFIMLALDIISTIIMYLSLLILIPFILILGGTINFGLFSVDISLFGIYFQMYSYIDWKYNSFLNFEYPVLETIYLVNNKKLLGANYKSKSFDNDNTPTIAEMAADPTMTTTENPIKIIAEYIDPLGRIPLEMLVYIYEKSEYEADPTNARPYEKYSLYPDDDNDYTEITFSNEDVYIIDPGEYLYKIVYYVEISGEIKEFTTEISEEIITVIESPKPQPNILHNIISSMTLVLVSNAGYYGARIAHLLLEQTYLIFFVITAMLAPLLTIFFTVIFNPKPGDWAKCLGAAFGYGYSALALWVYKDSKSLLSIAEGGVKVAKEVSQAAKTLIKQLSIITTIISAILIYTELWGLAGVFDPFIHLIDAVLLTFALITLIISTYAAVAVALVKEKFNSFYKFTMAFYILMMVLFIGLMICKLTFLK